MSLTDVLAVVGAVTGVSGAALGVASYRRDRSRLLVRLNQGGTPTEDGYVNYVRVFVINAGRQPVAIVEAGLSEARRGRRDRIADGLENARALLRLGRLRYLGASWPALESSDEPAVLQPGDLRKFILLETEDPEFARTEAPVYGFATDALGRTSWSRGPVLTGMAGWTSSASDPVAR